MNLTDPRKSIFYLNDWRIWLYRHTWGTTSTWAKVDLLQVGCSYFYLLNCCWYVSFIYASSTEDHSEHLRSVNTPHRGQPEIMVTQFAHESFLAPLIEHEGEAYLENTRGIRRHTVANVHSDIQLLSVKNRMCLGKVEVSGATRIIEMGRKKTQKSLSSEPAFFHSRQVAVEIPRHQSTAEIQCGLTS